MYCENCGAKNAEKNTFCAKCGHKMVREEEKEIKEERKETKPKSVKEDQEERKYSMEMEETMNMNFRFEQEKYLSYIAKVQHSITMTYVYWFLIGLMFSLIIIFVSKYQTEVSSIYSSSSSSDGMMIFAVIPPIVGLIIAHARTLEKKIRVQEMKWKLDFYIKYVK